MRDNLPAIGSVEKYIGFSGDSLVFHTVDDVTGEPLEISPYDLIKKLALKLNHPQVKEVRVFLPD